ncbi:hypothetical protein SEUBUCD646_0C00880 [Saccharomyces eubayanus]|uniref:GATA-type domain-containing protein n=2 Tax=Saccharomyces TaxID=4930 RepID=A0A6C1E593_SACPS|nr:hypothetical protein GRS66_006392 [Saccharomyces pastorianus]CAI1875488.1 hypothetical protein SEUBUCD650_0C00840 [Saccharomyces eubayanus]CAI1909160.1 hypothetical protein SEUBUCD646_0C00880 [Saccharomyces eubayanus]
MRYNNYDNSGNSFVTKVVKKTDIKKIVLENKDIGGWKLNGKRKAYKERGKVFVSCSFIEVSLSQINIVDIEKKFQSAEQLRGITRDMLNEKDCSSHEIAPSKNCANTTRGSERVTSSGGIKTFRNSQGQGQGDDGSTTSSKRHTKTPASRPKREKRQTVLPNGEIKECARCRDTWTIQWRSGPAQNRELCSPCGLAYGKRIKKEEDERKGQARTR